MKYKLDKQAHSVFALTYHYICCIKYRRKIFDKEPIINRLKELNINIANNFDVEIINQETDKDHVHILFKSNPKLDIIKFINSLKGTTSRYLRKEFPEIKHILYRGVLWSPSYFLCTTGQVTLDQLKEYVESQGEKKNDINP